MVKSLRGIKSTAADANLCSLHVYIFPAGLAPAYSPRSSTGFQWISGISGFHSQEPGIEGQAHVAFTQLQSKKT